jgi:ATP-dependent DNA helicase 2 subunit 1
VEIKKAYKFAGTQVLFKPEEQRALKTWGTPILRIIGFKPQSMLPMWASMKKSTFIYPSEEHYVGSTRVFSALWQKLLKDNKMGIAWYIARSNASPVLVAILPSQERLDEHTKGQVIPAGLWLYQLPFADDIRPPPMAPKPLVAPDSLVDEMRKVVQQLQLPKAIYDPSKYPNPSLQWHYRILQAIALDEELPDTPEDKTIPKYRQIDKRAGEYVKEWGRILDEQVRAYQKANYGGIDGTAVKRQADDDNDEAPKKKVKVEKSSLSAMSTDDLRKLIAKGALGKHTVAELKDLLSIKGINAMGKKQDLVDRVEQWVEDN